jgi:rhodanese-related sulfurtransferase
MLELHDKRMANSCMVILDVREDRQAQQLPIPPWYKPLHIGRGVLEKSIREKIPDPNTEIVVVSGGEGVSVKSAETLKSMGYTNVASLKEGVEALVAGCSMAPCGVRKGFVDSVGNTPLIRLNR